MFSPKTCMVAVLLLLTGVSSAQSKRKPMSDTALDSVTAAGITAQAANGVISFQGQVPTANGLVSSAGTLAVQNVPASGTNGTLTLTGGAQQNLSSLVNINAVNSVVNVLLNLNVNINSTVGTLTQTNLNSIPGKH